jgi:hypothetical protein
LGHEDGRDQTGTRGALTDYCTAREEKKRARDAKLAEAENECMMRLYRQHVLNEQPGEPLVQIGSIQPAPAKETNREEVGSFGD